MTRPKTPAGQLPLFGEPPAPPARATVDPAAVPRGLQELAATLPAGLRLGTSSWSFPGWKGIVYGRAASKERLAREGLRAYARHPLLRAVGIDRTYYAPLAAEDFAKYAEQVPPDFRFLVKAHELCTSPRLPRVARHAGRAGGDNEWFLDADYATEHVVVPFVDGLGDRGGALLFQFPPLGRRELREPSRFVERLHRFLARLPAGPSYAVEIRNEALFGREYLDALADAGAVHCLNVHPTMPSISAQRRLTAEGARRDPAHVARSDTTGPSRDAASATRSHAAGRPAERDPAAGAPEGAAPATGGPVVVRWMLHSGLAYEEARQRYHPFDRLVDEDEPARAAIAALCRDAAAAGRSVFVIANNKAEGSAPLTLFALAEAVAAIA